MFGHPVTLTYKGKNSFKTSWGSCVTIVFFLALVWVAMGLSFQTYFQSVKKYTTYRNLVNPALSDPDISSDASFSFGGLSIDKTGLKSLELTDPESLFRIKNLDTLTAQLGKVEMYRTVQDENVDVGILKVCEGTPTKTLLSVATAKYQCLTNDNEYSLFDSQQPYMYETTDYWENTEQVALKIRPCVFDGSNVCSSDDSIKDFFDNHTLRLSIR